MKRGVWIGIGIVVIVLGLIFAAPSCFVLSIIRQIAGAEAAVTDPAAYSAAATSLARLCQSDPFLFCDEPPLAPAWTPPEILKLHPTWVEISPDEARIEFGGGFHHFGYYSIKPRPLAVRRWEALPIQRALIGRINKLSFREGPEGQEGELICTSGKANPT